MDEPLRLRMDLDLRAPDQASVGVAQAGERTEPARLQQAAILLACDLGRAALDGLGAADRARAGAALEALGPDEVAGLLRGRGIDGVVVSDLPAGAQVGARGLCARLVLHPGTPPLEALTSVDLIGMDADDAARRAWLARAPLMVPRLLTRAGVADPGVLARALVALRALGRAARTTPERLGDPRLARLIAEEALAGEPVALTRELHRAQAAAATAAGAAAEGAGHTAPLPRAAPAPPPPSERATEPLPQAAVRPPAEPAAPATAPMPAAAREPRRGLADHAPAVAVAALAAAALALALLVAVLVAPGAFGLARESGVAEVRTELADARRAVERAEQALRSSDLDRVQVELIQLTARIEQVEQDVAQVCGVLPLVC